MDPAPWGRHRSLTDESGLVLAELGEDAPQAGAGELGPSIAVWPRTRRMKDRAGAIGIVVMPAKNMGQNCSGNQIKKVTRRLGL